MKYSWIKEYSAIRIKTFLSLFFVEVIGTVEMAQQLRTYAVPVEDTTSGPRTQV